jgi:hypothetical protein
VLVFGSACVAVAATLGVAAYAVSAGPGSESIDPGPSIDYCPTPEQVEAHFEEYGFDYKPTVPCGENGEELPPVEEPPAPSEEELFSQEKEAIATATIAPDADGNPLTIELVLADGSKATMFVDGNPKVYKDITPAELAEVLYP